MIGCYRFSKKVAPHSYGIKVIQIFMGGIITRFPRPSRIKAVRLRVPSKSFITLRLVNVSKEKFKFMQPRDSGIMGYNKKKYGQNSGSINRQITGEVHIQNTPLDVDSIAAVPTYICM